MAYARVCLCILSEQNLEGWIFSYKSSFSSYCLSNVHPSVKHDAFMLIIERVNYSETRKVKVSFIRCSLHKSRYSSWEILKLTNSFWQHASAAIMTSSSRRALTDSGWKWNSGVATEIRWIKERTCLGRVVKTLQGELSLYRHDPFPTTCNIYIYIYIYIGC
mgnify:CR=1 FL=1